MGFWKNRKSGDPADEGFNPNPDTGGYEPDEPFSSSEDRPPPPQPPSSSQPLPPPPGSFGGGPTQTPPPPPPPPPSGGQWGQPYGQQPPPQYDPYGQPGYNNSGYNNPGYGNPAYGYQAPQRLPFNISGTYEWAWQALKNNLAVVATAYAVLIILGISVSIVQSVVNLNDPGWLIEAIMQFGGVLVATIGNYTVVKATLAISAGKSPTVEEIFEMDRFVPFVVTALIVSLLTTVGLVLFIIPGLLVMFFTYLAPFLVIDQERDPIDALQESYRITAANIGPILLFALSTIVVGFLGLLACCVGLLIAIPLIGIASAGIYRDAVNQAPR